MTTWSDYWSAYWGGNAPSESRHAQIALDQYPDLTRDTSPKVLALTAAMVGVVQTHDNQLGGAKPQIALDFRSANGKWLDYAGAMLLVPRDGRSDSYYREILEVYAKHVWPNRRTVDGMLNAVKQINNSGIFFYQEFYPMSYVVMIGDVTDGSHRAWDMLQILKRARPTCYNGFARVQFDDPFLWSDNGGAPVTTDAWGDAGTSYEGGRWNHIEVL